MTNRNLFIREEKVLQKIHFMTTMNVGTKDVNKKMLETFPHVEVISLQIHPSVVITANTSQMSSRGKRENY